MFSATVYSYSPVLVNVLSFLLAGFDPGDELVNQKFGIARAGTAFRMELHGREALVG